MPTCLLLENKKVIIIGAGPAGLTAAYEFLTQTSIKAIVLEQSESMGGISRTVNFKGNRIDIGGHRFFSKSQRVIEWWLKMLPLEASENGPATIRYHLMETLVNLQSPTTQPSSADAVMLLRPRKSRIYYLRRFFDYPISLSKNTLLNLGLMRTIRIAVSYLQSVLFPIKNETNLEQFFINRFGKELYTTFFKSYTFKVWGVPCHHISAAWGAQRIKGLSAWGTITHALKKLVTDSSNGSSIQQQGTQTSFFASALILLRGSGIPSDSMGRHSVWCNRRLRCGRPGSTVAGQSVWAQLPPAPRM